MSRKSKRGYFVQGHFVTEGSELDLELKRASKGDADTSKTDRKRASTALQKMGEQLLSLNVDKLAALPLPDRLRSALADSKQHTQFGAKRRHMQYIGKIMRTLDEDAIAAIEQAVDSNQSGSAADAALLHQAESWRTRLLDQASHADAIQAWVQQAPNSDLQQLRALIRQAHKDLSSTSADTTANEQPAAQHIGNSRAYKALFQYLKTALEQQAKA